VAKEKSIADSLDAVTLIDAADNKDKVDEREALRTGGQPWWLMTGKKTEVFDEVHRKQFPHPVVKVCVRVYNMYIYNIYMSEVSTFEISINQRYNTAKINMLGLNIYNIYLYSCADITCYGERRSSSRRVYISRPISRTWSNASLSRLVLMMKINTLSIVR
jgi:hypothetical protein